MTREEAIKILRNTAWLGTNEDREKTEQAIEVVAEALEREPKRGHWLEAREEDPCWYRCSECGRLYDLDENYCPNCGARMESDEK